ncbi:amino acid ABC transporter permease [Paracoccus seriniphilus]|uniref:General L-amino acid transport system permease protein n=1 Tax=Paracoccus seriniphilus TaxID=184748 RepID=A0A239PZ73_9RHOB|nr:amino acid ABC transporter permease [Paracoccus seriniphilus]WCR15692.1 amino acid ABC transporter permease [Paracoccus seriniphilus]SNT75631.1 general L-amino acid transport system permease protein [Paracoccus seriniphilus]
MADIADIPHSSAALAVSDHPVMRFVSHMRKHPVQGLISLGVLMLLGWVALRLGDWAILHAVWNSPDGQLCRAEDAGACWAVIRERWRIIIFGLYPYEEQWRSALACLLLFVTGVLSCMPRFWHARRLGPLWIVAFTGFATLMWGGVAGMPYIPTREWGGLALTLFVFASVVLLTMPTALVLLLLRQSPLPLVRRPTQFIIDAVRSLPLLVVMFVAGVLLPFGLPDFMVGEKLFRVIAGFTLYVSCYQAEILRGGIQSLPKGQDEAGKALGLSWWQRMRMVVLPQAFKVTLPATINQIVIIFLETPLIVVIGFFDVLASGAAAFGTAEWGIASVEVYLFIGAIFFAFSFSLSRYGAFLEARLARSSRR